jgi:hypothetical protein
MPNTPAQLPAGGLELNKASLRGQLSHMMSEFAHRRLINDQDNTRQTPGLFIPKVAVLIKYPSEVCVGVRPKAICRHGFREDDQTLFVLDGCKQREDRKNEKIIVLK